MIATDSIDCTDSSRVVLVDASPKLAQLPVSGRHFDCFSADQLRRDPSLREFQASHTCNRNEIRANVEIVVKATY